MATAAYIIVGLMGLAGLAITVVLIDDCLNGKRRTEQEIAWMWFQSMRQGRPAAR